MNGIITLRQANGEETQIQAENNLSIDLEGISQVSLPFNRSDFQSIQFDGAQLEITLSSGEKVFFEAFSDAQGVLVPLLDQSGSLLFANTIELLSQLEETAAGAQTTTQNIGGGSGFTPEETNNTTEGTNDNSYRNLRGSSGSDSGDDVTGTTGSTFTAAPNHAPIVVAEPDFGAIEDAAVVAGQVEATDIDSDAASLSYSLIGEAPAGLTFNPDGSYSFDPSVAAYQDLALNETREVSFSWKATDSHNADSTDTDTVTITVSGTNDAPIVVAEPDFGAIEGASVIEGQVEATDIDSDDDAASLSYSLVGEAPAGLTFNPDGSYSFDPSAAAYQELAQGETREVSFSWKATDSHNADSSNTDTVTITVTGTNGPVAFADSPAADFSQGQVRVAGSATLDALGANNSDFAISFTLNLAGEPTGQFQTLLHKGDSAVEFVPGIFLSQNSNTLFFALRSDESGTKFSTSTTELPPGEDTRVTFMKVGNEVKLFINGELDTGFSFSFEGNVTINNGDLVIGQTESFNSFDNLQGSLDDIQIHNRALSEAELASIADGDVVEGDNLIAHYDFDGADPYRDLSGNGNDGVASGTIEFTEAGTEDDVITVDVLANDIDADGDSLSIVSFDTQVSHNGEVVGSVSKVLLDGREQLQFTPNDKLAAGEVALLSFNYTIGDGHDGTDTASVNLSVTGTNDAPLITSDASDATGTAVEAGVETTDGVTTEVAAVVAGGTLTASDIDNNDGQTWTHSGGETSAYGQFAITESGEWSFTLNTAAGSAADRLAEGETLTETFTVTVTDNFGATAEQVVSVNILGTNDAPVAFADSPAADFSQGQVRVAGSATLDALGANNSDFAISFTLNLAGEPTGQFQTLLHKGDTQGESVPGIFLSQNSNTILIVLSSDVNAFNFVASTTVLPIGEDTRVTFMKVGNEVKLFINGELDTSFSFSFSGDVTPNSGDLFIGQSENFNSFDNLQGSLDNIQIHNRALSDAELVSIADGGVVEGDNLIAHYNFDGADPYLDLSGNGNDGVASGTIVLTNAGTEDDVITVDVLANDFDADGDSLSIVSFDTQVSHNGEVVGSVSKVLLDGREQLQFTPNDNLTRLSEGEVAELAFDYVVSDGNDGEASATVQLKIEGTLDYHLDPADSSAVILDDTSVDIDSLINSIGNGQVNKIDMTGDNQLLNDIDAQDVLDLTDGTNTLVIEGDAGDNVSVLGSNWNDLGSEDIGGQTYNVYSKDSAILKIEDDIDTSIDIA